MKMIKNALFYVRNHQEIPIDMVRQYLLSREGITDARPSVRAHGLIFFDYQPQTVSLGALSKGLWQQGVQSRLIDL